MKKTLLLSSLLFAVFNSGCAKQVVIQNGSNRAEIPIQHTPAPQVINTSTPEAMPQNVPTTVSSGNSHQLRTIRGTTVTVGERSNGFVFPQYQGKTVLLQIFGKDCPYCFEEMPIISNLSKKYGQKLQIVSIQAQDPMDKATAANLINRFQMNYPIIERDESVDLLFFIRQTYGWNGILPYTLLIKNGVTEYSFSGKAGQQELEESVRSLF
jgi:thiol-disulfide isomerase/thioredoxin